MKRIAIREDVYETLARMKRPGENISDVIDRLIPGKRTDIREYAGALRDSKVMDELDAFAKRVRQSARVRG